MVDEMLDILNDRFVVQYGCIEGEEVLLDWTDDIEYRTICRSKGLD